MWRKRHATPHLKNDQIFYHLTEHAYENPFLRALFFELYSYELLLWDLKGDKEFLMKVGKTIPSDDPMLGIHYWDVPPTFILQKSEEKLIDAFEKWITAIVLYTIVQELKTTDEWTSTIQCLVKKIKDLVQQKDMGKFEAVLRKRFIKRNIYGSQIIESLDTFFENTEKHEKIQSSLTKFYEERKKSFEKNR